MERRHWLICKTNSFHNCLYVLLSFLYVLFSFGCALFSFGYALFSFKLCTLFICFCVLFIPLCDYFIRLCAFFVWLWLCALSIIRSFYAFFLCGLCILNGIKVQVCFEKTSKKSSCAVMIKIIITFANQIPL